MNSSFDSMEPNIAFAGLTAAGKTTHAKILAKELGYEYVSATETILEIIGIDHSPDRIWFTNFEEIEKAREGDKVDIELESRMQLRAENSGRQVLDTWAMAWIYNGKRPIVRLWIESDELSRTKKCYVSQNNDKALNIDECNRLITKKDTDTRSNFQRRLNFDLYKDMLKYDIILDNSHLISEPTEGNAKQGIERFSPVILESVRYMIEQKRNSDFDHEGIKALKIFNKHDGMIKKLGKVTFGGN